ncbi:MAG: hypothetical protein K8T90_08620 [Planctomycetes bacterium]|nr:hypothetical protein [Planctomycetota bacterium]
MGGVTVVRQEEIDDCIGVAYFPSTVEYYWHRLTRRRAECYGFFEIDNGRLVPGTVMVEQDGQFSSVSDFRVR